MESTAETIRIRTPTEVKVPACRRVSTRAKVPTSPSPWRRPGWSEPPSALHRHAASAARTADTPGTASRSPYTGTGTPRGRHTRSRAGLNLPRFGRHARSHESAVGVCHGQTQAAGVHDGVQGAGSPDRPGEREVRGGGGAGTGSHGDGAAELGAAGGDRRRPGPGGGADDPGAGGARAPAAREPDAADGARHPKKSDGLLREGEPVRFGFIAAEKAAFPVRLLCRTLQVSRAGFYAWQARPPAPRARAADRRRRRFRVTTQSRHPFPIAPNVLARQFARAAPDHAWVTDITYIPTGEGWLYLAVILDLCSRFAVGWAMSERITEALTLDALGLALARRRPAPGLLHHSDRGSQYAGGDYQRVLAQHGIVCSMSRRGDCWDNAVAESFFATLKVELVHDAAWATRAAARTDLFEYLEVFYNGQRRHSALGYLSPRVFEQRHEQDAVAT